MRAKAGHLAHAARRSLPATLVARALSLSLPATLVVRSLILSVLVILAACTAPEPETQAPGLRVADVLGGGSTPGDPAAGTPNAEKDADISPENTTAENTVARFARAEAPREFAFPADYGAHPQFRSEWWYLTMVLTDEDDGEYGVQFTIFRQALFPGGAAADPWRNGQAFLGHFAVTDVQAGIHREAERLARGHPALAGARVCDGRTPALPRTDNAATAAQSNTRRAATTSTPDCSGPGFILWLEGWRLAASGDDWTLQAKADDIAASLRLIPTRPVVLQGDRGLSAKGPGQASFYYSLPRLKVSGSLQIGDSTRTVAGLAWLDREWSTSVLGPKQVGWDWFALMLDSGEDLMAFRLRRADSERDPYDQGIVIDAAGNAQRLGPRDFVAEPLDYWRDERGVRWPIRWSLRTGNRQWLIQAPVKNQRMDTLLTYWEGLVHVLDPQGARVGSGYMELTGYR